MSGHDDDGQARVLFANFGQQVQAAIQGEQVRVTGKKRDDLQEAIAALRAKTFDMPLQFNNFRD